MTLPPQVEAVYPLTPTQRGLLFHSLLAPDSGVYGVQLVFELHGLLDSAAFDAAWQLLAARHAVLRTAFAWERLDAPLQVVGRQVRLPVVHEDWRADAQADARWQAWLQADRERGFELRRAPLARIACLRLEETRQRVVFSHHHLLLDGWSLPLLLRDWQAAYRAALAGAAPALPPAPSLQQHLQWQAAQDAAAAGAFWRTLLAGFDTPSTPGFVRATAAPGAAGRMPCVAQRRLDGAVLQALARRARVTPGTVLQGLWALLLARSSGCADVVYGLVRAGRPPSRPDAAATVGPLLTTLPVRTRLPHAMPLAAWLRELQDAVLAQQPHEHAGPAEVQRAAAALAPGQPLFDSVVVIENYPAASPQHDAPLRLGAVQVHEATHYALSLYAVPGAALELRLLADPARVAAADAEACLERLAALLQQAAADPARPLGTFGLDDAPLRAALAAADRAAQQPAPAWLTPQAIAAAAQAQPEAVALVDERGALGRAGLQALAARIAARLQAQGVQPGDCVGVALPRGREMVAALLAAWRLGAAYLPLDAGHPPARLQQLLADAAPRTLLLNAATRDAFAAWPGARCDLDAPAPDRAPPAPVALQAASPAYLIYTSGSTGTPKGVWVGHGALANLLAAMNRRIGLDTGARWLAVTTLSFDIAALELFGPLQAGACCVIAGEAEARDAERLAARIAAERIDTLQATPSTWRLLVAAGWRAPRDFRLLCGGEALDRPLARALAQDGAALWNVYGPTETTLWSTALHLTPALLAEDSGTLPIGGALDNTTLRVLDPLLRPLPPGVPGELAIGGAGVALGYHRRAALNAERFVPDPLGPRSGAWLYRTGDRVVQRADGLFHFLGRFDHQVKLRGQRLELGEIEAALGAHAAVQQAAAALHGEGAAQRLLAYVVAQPGVDADALPRGLAAHLRERLPAALLPAAIHLLPSLPLNANGKLDRRALQPPAAARTALPAAATPLQAELLALWRELLQQPALGLHDTFFEAGGHSLLLLTLQGRLRERLGRELPLVELFNHPTVASLAERLAAAEAAPAAGAEAELAARAAGRERLLRRRQEALPAP